jgi:uncharacterized protein YkwD
MARKLSILAAIAALFTPALVSNAAAARPHLRQRVAGASPVAQASNRPAVGGTLIAPPATCPNQSDLADPVETQELAMRCMTNFARVHAGLQELADSSQLDLSAGEKSGDVIACNSFSHTACGREFTYWMRQAGYMSSQCWRVGENLAWGTNEAGTVGSIFQAWMRSPGHRENILGEYDQLGVSLSSGGLEGRVAAHVWAEHFGSHCEG